MLLVVYESVPSVVPSATVAPVTVTMGSVAVSDAAGASVSSTRSTNAPLSSCTARKPLPASKRLSAPAAGWRPFTPAVRLPSVCSAVKVNMMLAVLAN